MLVYLSGPMTGIEYYNFPAFDAAQKAVLEMFDDVAVLSPAEHDRDMGYDYLSGEVRSQPFPIKEALLWDLQAVADCDALYMLKGWHRSPGARLEHDFGRLLGKKFIFEEET
jgi:hypothetical protein